MDPNTDRTKWLVLIGSIICMLALGTIYTWSLFNQPLSDKFGWALPDVAFTFAITSISLSMASLMSGKLQEKFGIRNVAIGSGICLGIGFFLASKVTTLWGLYLTAGVLVGAADGVAYMMILANCIKWFPERQGLISGLSVSAYGTGSLLFKYINMYDITTSGVMASFAIWGVVAIGLSIIGGLLLREAPKVAAVATNTSAAVTASHQFTWQEMLKTPQAWLLAFVFLSCCMAGLFMISIAKDLATELQHLPLALAAGAVTTVSLCNTAGRLVLGQMSDIMPRIRVISIITFCLAVACGALAFLTINVPVFFVCVGLVAFCFGGTVSVYPALTGDFFGLANMTKNYGVLYQGFGVGAVAGSFMSSWLGGIVNALGVVAVLCCISFVITMLIKKPVKD